MLTLIKVNFIQRVGFSFYSLCNCIFVYPHFFLYYFSSESEMIWRGVIFVIELNLVVVPITCILVANSLFSV